MKTISVFCFLLYAAGIGGAEINVEGFEGGEVSFRCSHRFAWKNHKYFCQAPCTRSEDTLVTVQSGSRAKTERITLVDSGDGVFTVTFSQLQLSDSGTYYCAVDRPGLDTFTEVFITVKEGPHTAVANVTQQHTNVVISELSPTWTNQNISNSTQLTPGMDISRPTNLSTASNCTNEGQHFSTGTILYATVGAFIMLTVLMLAIIVRKRRENSKPHPQVCSNSTDLVSADETEADCEYDDIGEEVQSVRGGKRFSCSHHQKQDPPTSASTAAKCNTPFHIYENICCSKGTAHSRCSTANVQHQQSIGSGIYIKPLPPISGRTGEGCQKKHKIKPRAKTNATLKPKESCTGNACSDSTEVRPRSLWFGLDLSGTKV